MLKRRIRNPTPTPSPVTYQLDVVIDTVVDWKQESYSSNPNVDVRVGKQAWIYVIMSDRPLFDGRTWEVSEDGWPTSEQALKRWAGSDPSHP